MGMCPVFSLEWDPMKQIIKEILEAEERVNNALQQARQKAAEIRLAAETEISARINEAKQEAREIVQTAVDEAKQEAQRIREARLREADREQEALLDSRTSSRQELVDRLCASIMTTTGGIDEQ